MGILTQRKKVFRWQQMYYYRKDTQKKNNQLFAFFELAQSSVTSEALIAQHPHRGHLEQRGSKAGKKQTNKKNKQDEEKTSKRAFFTRGLWFVYMSRHVVQLKMNIKEWNKKKGVEDMSSE